MATDKLRIFNRALQLLGSPQIANVNENSRGATALRRAYDAVLEAELRANTWSFSIKRAELVADATPPIFGKANQYPLPGDYLFLAPEETTYGQPRKRDYQIEGQKILSDEGSPLEIRYCSNSITESMFDVLFAEALAASLADACCEEITNSNTKSQKLMAYRKQKIDEAKKRNSIEQPPRKAPVGSWISCRY